MGEKPHEKSLHGPGPRACDPESRSWAHRWLVEFCALVNCCGSQSRGPGLPVFVFASERYTPQNLAQHHLPHLLMPRVKTDSLEKGMRVMTDVKNMDEMLLIPAGATLTERQINILQAWGIEEIEVQQSAAAQETDPLARLTPETI